MGMLGVEERDGEGEGRMGWMVGLESPASAAFIRDALESTHTTLCPWLAFS